MFAPMPGQGPLPNEQPEQYIQRMMAQMTTGGGGPFGGPMPGTGGGLQMPAPSAVNPLLALLPALQPKPVRPLVAQGPAPMPPQPVNPVKPMGGPQVAQGPSGRPLAGQVFSPTRPVMNRMAGGGWMGRQ